MCIRDSSLQRDNVKWLLDHTNPVVAIRVGANCAGVDVRRIEAVGAQGYPLLDLEDSLGQAHRIVSRGFQDVIRQPRSRFWPNARKFGKLVDQSANWLRGHRARSWWHGTDSVSYTHLRAH